MRHVHPPAAGRPLLLPIAVVLVLVLVLALVGAARAAPPDKHPMLGANDRQALVPEDLALFYEKVARGVEAELFAHLVETDVLRAEVADLSRAVESHRSWTAFTAAELDSLTLRHNVLIEALELDGEDKISCVRANVVGSRITAAVCSAWGR